MESGMERRGYNGREDNGGIWIAGTIIFLSWPGIFTDIFKYVNSLTCTLLICVYLFVYVLPQKMFEREKDIMG